MTSLQPLAHAALQPWLIGFLLNAIWQAPLVMAAAWLAARSARPAGPRWEHRLWVAALFAQLLFPLATLESSRLSISAILDAARTSLLSLWSQPTSESSVRIILGPVITFAPRGLHLAPWAAQLSLLAYAACLCWLTARFIRALVACHRLRYNSTPVPQDHPLCTAFFRQCPTTREARVQIAYSTRISAPHTIGIFHPLLLLPPAFLAHLSDVDLDALLAHEAAHIRRRDFVKNLVYTLLALPLGFHPAVWLVRSRIAASREMICDDLAAQATSGPRRYALALLRMAALLAAPPPRPESHAIGILDAFAFERRIMQLTQSYPPARPVRRILIAVTCAALAFTATSSAWAFRLHFDDKSAAQQPPKKIRVQVTNLTLLHRVPPVYPIDAKKSKITGSVVLAVEIGTSGEPEHISVTSGPEPLQQSALDAVRQWKWQPFLLNGQPVVVLTDVTIVYELTN